MRMAAGGGTPIGRGNWWVPKEVVAGCGATVEVDGAATEVGLHMHVQHFPENSDESYVLCVLMSLGWLWRLGMCCLTVGWLGGWGCVVSHWGVWGIGVWWEGGDDT